MKTRIFCLLLVTIMVLSCFAGCSLFGKKDNDTDNEGNQPPVEGPPQIGTGTGEDEGDWWTKIKYDETDLLFKMTKCDNTEELSSGCAQYLAGEYDDTRRNGNADGHEATHCFPSAVRKRFQKK